MLQLHSLDLSFGGVHSNGCINRPCPGILLVVEMECSPVSPSLFQPCICLQYSPITLSTCYLLPSVHLVWGYRRLLLPGTISYICISPDGLHYGKVWQELIDNGLCPILNIGWKGNTSNDGFFNQNMLNFNGKIADDSV